MDLTHFKPTYVLMSIKTSYKVVNPWWKLDTCNETSKENKNTRQETGFQQKSTNHIWILQTYGSYYKTSKYSN